MQNRSIRRWPRVVSWIGFLSALPALGYYIGLTIQSAPALHRGITLAVLAGCILAYGTNGFLGRREKERYERTGEIVLSRSSHVYNANNRRLHDRQRMLPEDTFEDPEEVTVTMRQRPRPALGPEDPSQRREPPFAIRENTGGWPEVT